MNEKSAIPTALEIARKVAPHLPGWVARAWSRRDGTTHETLASLERRDGAKIRIAVEKIRYEFRVIFSPEWPAYQDGRDYFPGDDPLQPLQNDWRALNITSSPARSPASMATMLERRLLCRYEPAYAIAVETVRNSNAAARETWTAAERLSRAFRATLPRIDGYRVHRNADAIKLETGPGVVSGLTVHPAYNDHPVRVSMKLEGASVDDAQNVLALFGLRREP